MNESLDGFIRDVLPHDDDVEVPSAPSVVVGAFTPGAGLGSLPGHAVQSLIALGGMGKVYRATQHALEREVAVKVMTSLAQSPETAERFRREALILGRLAHPNIVPVYDVGMDDEGQPFYTMKLVKGRTLQAILTDLSTGDAGALQQHPMVSLLTVFRKICDALAFAHSQGVLHRDLKPENIMVGEFGEVLVMDWGLAKIIKEEEGKMKEDPPPPRDSVSSFILHPSSFSGTLQGSVIGTPQYMSPEQAMGLVDELDERSDIFSLGGIFYAILTLRAPVDGKTLSDILRKVKSGSITSPLIFSATLSKAQPRATGAVPEARLSSRLPHLPGGRVPAALSAVAMQALALDKAGRYQSVAALIADIGAYQGGCGMRAAAACFIRCSEQTMRRGWQAAIPCLVNSSLPVG